MSTARRVVLMTAGHPLRGFAGPSACRNYTTQGNNTDTDHASDSSDSAAGPKTSGSGDPSPYITWDRYSLLDKDIALMKMRLGNVKADLGKLKADLKDLDSKIDKKFDQAGKKAEQVDKKSEQVDKRFEQVDKRFEQVDKRFEQADKKSEQVDKKSEQVDKRFEQVNKKINYLVYFFLGGFVLKGGFSFYKNMEDRMDHTAKKEK